MKIVIQHGKTERTIQESFALCGSSDDLQRVAKQILAAVEDRYFGLLLCGWIELLPPLKTVTDAAIRSIDELKERASELGVELK